MALVWVNIHCFADGLFVNPLFFFVLTIKIGKQKFLCGNRHFLHIKITWKRFIRVYNIVIIQYFTYLHFFLRYFINCSTILYFCSNRYLKYFVVAAVWMEIDDRRQSYFLVVPVCRAIFMTATFSNLSQYFSFSFNWAFKLIELKKIL